MNKEIYLALHPETAHGATLKQGTKSPSRQVGDSGDVSSFVDATAASTGESARAVQRKHSAKAVLA